MNELIKKLKAMDARVRKLCFATTAEEQAEHDRLVGTEAENREYEAAKEAGKPADAPGERGALLRQIERQKRLDANEAETARLEHEQAERDAAAKRAAATVGGGRLSTADGRTQNGVEVVALTPAPNVELERRGGFATHREFLSAVMSFGQGRSLDKRLEKRMTVGSDEARGNSDPAGGFLIPEAFSPDLLRIDPESDPMGGLTRKVPMTNPIVKIPARSDKDHSSSVSGGLTVTRRPETVAGTASQMTMERVTLEAHTLFGLSYATEEILTDSPISFIALLEAGFSDQFTYHLVNERINGTGVGEFLGVLNSGCLISVSKESGQAAATIVKENIDKMRSRCWRYGQAVWLANHDTLPQLKSLAQVVGVGGAPVPYISIDSDKVGTLDGRPIIFTEYCKTLGTVGDLILGCWGEYLEGTYQPMMSAESMHVRFVNHERAFKFWIRNAGLPWWRVALTPKNSTNTLSPFVALATRS